ncbi:nuclease-related domain-containing protein [Nakamurella panacisegetis]|nr:nuclease-related domain-containing protein [Nakamurella panacisegetis]
MLSGVGLGAGGTAAVLLFVHGSFARGMVVGAAFVLVFGGLAVLVMQLTGTAPLGMGAQAEVWTASELRPLRRHGWRMANHLLLRFGDIDHLLVGRHGVLVIETKWSADTWSLDSDRVGKALQQVKRNAHDIRIWRPELRHGSPEVVRPVLFLWGGTRSDVPKPDHVETINGVDVIYGLTAARQWREALIQRSGTPELSDEQVTAVWDAVTTNAHHLDQREQRETAPPSVASIFMLGLGTVFAAILSVLACLYSMEAITPGWARVILFAAFTAVGLLARRWTPTRTIALGWLTGTGFTAVLALAALLTGRA